MKTLSKDSEAVLFQLVCDVSQLSLEVESLRDSIVKESLIETEKELKVTIDGKTLAKFNLQEDTYKKESDGSISIDKNHFKCNEDDSITLYDGIFRFGDKVVIMSQGKEVVSINEKGFTINH